MYNTYIHIWIPSLRDDAPRLSCAKKDRRWPTPLLGLPGMGDFDVS